MPQQRLHPIGDRQVVREIIPGGNEPRQYRLYDNMLSARGVRWLADRSCVPNILVQLVDDGRIVSADILDGEQSMVEEEFSHAA